jgi:DNA-binding MarR family transcriptional regulator
MSFARLNKRHYELLAHLRYTLRNFLRFSGEAAAAAGLSPQQHQALLAIKGFPERDYVSVGELAERLHLQHHSAVGLVNRLVARQLVRKTPAKSDRRRMEVRLTPRGESALQRLSAVHLAELRQREPELRKLLASIARTKQ